VQWQVTYGANDSSWSDFLVVKEGFSFPAPRQPLGFTHAPLKLTLGVLFPKVKQPGMKMIHLSSADDKNVWEYATDPCDETFAFTERLI
jgi:hypothetical protein